jgi:hypothetical protein
VTYTLIMNWGWFKHQDCRGAYSIHLSTCRVAQGVERNRNSNKIQGYEEGLASIEEARAEAFGDASARFTDTLKEYGFEQMIKICKCAR